MNNKYNKCPCCGLDFNDQDIKQYFLDKGNTGEEAEETARLYGWTPENPQCFRKEIGIEILGKYDGISEWQCPECDFAWDRWTGKTLREGTLGSKN